MTIALIDDSANDLETLYEYVCRYCRENKIHSHIEKFTNELLFLNSMEKVTYNLVFLDIYLKRATGIQIAKKIQEQDGKCQIVFTTNSTEHAVKAFSLHALDYLVKPYAYERLKDTMEHYEAVADKFSHYIELKEGRRYTRILLSDIIYTDYHNHYIQVHTTSCVIRSYMSFSEFLPMLSPYPQFLWCYRNCTVNMDHVERFDNKEFTLDNNERMPISKARRQEIMQTYSNYIFDEANGGMRAWS